MLALLFGEGPNLMTDITTEPLPTSTIEAEPKASGYAWYVLALMVLIYVFNFLDRQVITIVAPALKADLDLSDAQLGLLFGTAFALFFGLFGIPLAKFADGWSRVNSIAVGLSFWSVMTAVSGLAGNFTQLALARVGVGIGEASANPATYSLLQDMFPKSKRGTALSIYSSGIYIGVGASLILGGAVIGYWDANFTPATRPFGISGWQATFLAFGIPGLLLALLVKLTVKEPPRGRFDGGVGTGVSGSFGSAFRAMLSEMATMFPPTSMLRAWRSGTNPFAANMAVAALAVIIGWAITKWTGAMLAPAKNLAIANIGGLEITTNAVQWGAIAIGAYASFSWIQAIARRDPPMAKLIANPVFASLALIGGFASFISYGLSPFFFVYAGKAFGIGPEAGLKVGLILAFSGAGGTIFGGMLSDWARKRHPSGRLFVVLFAMTGGMIFHYLMMTATTFDKFLLFLAIGNGIHIMWLGPVAASTQDLVLPRMRGTATALFLLGTNVIGLGLGPYVTGLVSDVTGNLQFAMVSILCVYGLNFLLIFFAITRYPQMEASLADRARAAGEAV